MLLHLGIGGHGNRSTKLFGGHKPCYDGQWQLTGRYNMCCWAIELLVAATVFLTYPYCSMSIRKSEDKATQRWGKFSVDMSSKKWNNVHKQTDHDQHVSILSHITAQSYILIYLHVFVLWKLRMNCLKKNIPKF